MSEVQAAWWEVTAPIYDGREDAQFTMTMTVQGENEAAAMAAFVVRFASLRRDEEQKIVDWRWRTTVIHRDHGRDVAGESCNAIIMACELHQLLGRAADKDEPLDAIIRERSQWWTDLSDKLDERDRENQAVSPLTEVPS